MKVAIVGATGETGSTIVNGLLESKTTKFEILAVTRPSSLQKPEALELKEKGVEVVAADLDGPEDELAKLLTGVDVLIAVMNVSGLTSQIPLANASKAAGVKRFVPCFFATVAPPKGMLLLRDFKEDILNHIKKIHLPYTVIDVGWWYQGSLPRLPSGRIDYATTIPVGFIAGDGNTPFAITDLRDVGRYTTRIIADDRTLNKMVFAYSEVRSQNQIFSLIEKLSNETVERVHMEEEALKAKTTHSLGYEALKNIMESRDLLVNQYWYSMGVRGDNTPEYARYLGYLDGKELYPDFEPISFETYCQELLDGKGTGPYQRLIQSMMAKFAESQPQNKQA